MKASIAKIIKQFEAYPVEIRNFLTELILLEDDKLSVEHPQLLEKIDLLLDKEIENEDSKSSD